MEHIAILTKKLHFDQKILAGEKTIESRWYVNRIAPWDRIKAGETLYFKNCGEPVTLKATVAKVMQFEGLDEAKVRDLLKKYGKQICITDPEGWIPELIKKNYCILIWLKDAIAVKPFYINKSGFGISSAWLTVKRVSLLMNKS